MRLGLVSSEKEKKIVVALQETPSYYSSHNLCFATAFIRIPQQYMK